MWVHLLAEEEKQTNPNPNRVCCYSSAPVKPLRQLQPPDTDTPISVGGTQRDDLEDLPHTPTFIIIGYDKTHYVFPNVG